MRKCVALLVLAVSLPGFALAGDHVVTRRALETRLAEAASRRDSDLAVLGRTLATPQAQRAAALLGADPARLQASLAALSDQEAHDLALRAAALQQDPAAGLSADVNTLLIVFLIVAIVILVLKAV
jgi:hypothetical protein